MLLCIQKAGINTQKITSLSNALGKLEMPWSVGSNVKFCSSVRTSKVILPSNRHRITTEAINFISLDITSQTEKKGLGRDLSHWSDAFTDKDA